MSNVKLTRKVEVQNFDFFKFLFLEKKLFVNFWENIFIRDTRNWILNQVFTDTRGEQDGVLGPWSPGPYF